MLLVSAWRKIFYTHIILEKLKTPTTTHTNKDVSSNRRFFLCLSSHSFCLVDETKKDDKFLCNPKNIYVKRGIGATQIALNKEDNFII